MPKLFIPKSFEAPRTLSTEHFYFRVLDETVAQLDYEAVMSSREQLIGIFGPGSTWPEMDMTFEENIASLKVHQAEFDSQKAFAYSVFDASKSNCLGSVYIDPSRSHNYDCEVYFWIRNDCSALEQELFNTISSWLQKAWPFSRIAFPGRSISWEAWCDELTTKSRG